MLNSIKNRLIFMSFMQFYVWGAWLITIGNYWFQTKKWSGAEFGAIFSTLGFASIFMPTITGILADRWINAERLYGILHLFGAGALFCIPMVEDPGTFFWVIFLTMICYMPTISLSNSVAYNILKSNQYDVIKAFPPIRVWGTIGFIAAMWTTNLTGSKATEGQFYIAAVAAIVLGLYAFTLPACPPYRGEQKKSLKAMFGLDAFSLFTNYKMLLFFFFSMFLGAALQLTNMYGDTFLDDFKHVPAYGPDSFVVKYSTIIMSISQVSETLFILAIPFFLRRFGIKQVMLISLFAWVLRFALFAYGNPADGLWMIVLSCIVYGMAFDFFNVSGSLFIETNTDSKIRSSAQGLFMMMTNGFGAVFGSMLSGYVIDRFFTFRFTDAASLLSFLKTTPDNPAYRELIKFNEVLPDGTYRSVVEIKDWQPIWLTFALYAFVIAVLFAVLFRHKHDPKELAEISH
jgi:MFS transporter, NHS family, xanthosine permease